MTDAEGRMDRWPLEPAEASEERIMRECCVKAQSKDERNRVSRKGGKGEERRVGRKRTSG
jgi:hypothetical protein